MPGVLRIGPCVFGFFAADRNEPPHVHVTRDRAHAKFWLDPAVRLSFARGFAPHEPNAVRRLVEEHRAFLLEQWHDFVQRHPG